ncbi:hypothetical protein ASD37_06425 [Mycobacterium sp. Root135]|uniref:hypothetical protein n=1 Tax=Mycobacterium sp. Root135 TaxID=1736457 RepID=UPI0006F7627E|nr:hypothetical protein [Mycobacterium sp. Root135]KQY09984.1 hypothetical protein ASD37_06425 [Mycobacterium sp. Root135]
MSYEVDRAMSRRGREPGTPLTLLGFGLGLLAMSPGAVLYYRIFAPVAEGAFAAALFGIVAVVVFAVGIS